MFKPKQNFFLIFSAFTIVFGLVACTPSDNQAFVRKMKMAKWPELFLKEIVEWYMPDAIWTINNSNSVDINGSAIFRNKQASIMMKAKSAPNDSIWDLDIFIDGHAADSLEELEIYDNMAYSAAKGIIGFMSEQIRNPPATEISLDDIPIPQRLIFAYKCGKYATNPENFKTLSNLEMSRKTIDLAECSISVYSSNKKIVEYFTMINQSSRWSIIAFNQPKEINDYSNEIIVKDSVLMDLYNNRKKDAEAKDSSLTN